ncbi:LuxR C-terminal-related transcriptional regulator [Streptomyces sp. NPDC094466]|uniref:LuxR C-terminal-related transcriptional regulator n=1 Tax=Streptomyces sp. NPDC094466 TaxID=3366065 RepID=UPI00380C271A
MRTGADDPPAAPHVPHSPHSPHELCPPAIGLYAEALRTGHVPEPDAARAPCLVPLGLLRPDPDDPGRLLPVPAAAALTRLLGPLARDLDERLASAAALVDALTPLASIAGPAHGSTFTVLEGKPAIRSSIEEAVHAAEKHILTLHPGSKRPGALLVRARNEALAPLRRGVHMRHIYQHSARYHPNLKDYVDRLPEERLEIRTMEQTPERMFVFDRTTAFVAASADRDIALRITHPAVVSYLVHVYDVLWAGATPFEAPLETALPGAPVTAVQLGIARLLVEGHVDDVVARRMGISVRTCRAHIARLMQALGATSRTHLGALLVRSGISETDRRTPG